jgi:hypothetical protein
MSETSGDYDEYDDYVDDDPCDHEGHDVDILTGRAHCWRCGEAWWLTREELKRELKLFATSKEDDNGAS